MPITADADGVTVFPITKHDQFGATPSRPSVINIGGYNYRVLCEKPSLVDEEGEVVPLLGQTRHSELEVAISPELPSELQAGVLIHEILHIALHESGASQSDQEKEEALVLALESKLVAMFRNPQLIGYLLGTINGA